MVGGLFEEWCYVPGALAELKRYLDTGIDAFFAANTGLARRALSGKTPR
ncbi:glycerophosphodiester phosphodiesterase [Xanthomonas campestris]|nr:glycerophosphodiester phosphodiesterase [Xanthomonas campestris pv. campestris]WDJ01926.1 glycerophosphodiester phosphodiesterase [Xanthomonas campestris]WDJ47381.1 glycerophosphodiester phosphodiesterase [Xanthomonas campestris pv. campestris]WDJ89837.1 glycerophosphodiester phosphodiesterase [Xanthomonas campestris]WDK00515.1 glycerophosphodiester phosphodiesterase [Xanthomonas campestris]